MGAFQANILEAMKSLREDFQKSLNKTSLQVEVDQTSASASKPGPSNTCLDPPSTNPVESMDVDYDTALPPRLNSHSSHVDDASGHKIYLSRNTRGSPRPNQRSLLTLSNSMMWFRALPRTTTLINLTNLGLPLAEPRNILINQNTNLGPDIYLLPQRRISPLRSDIGLQNLLGRPTLIKTILNMTQIYREVALSDIPSQYAEEVDTFRRILKLPDPSDSLPYSSPYNEKGRQELRPRGPSSMLPLNSIIKDGFDKFDQDFQAANLPEGKYIKAPPSTAKWYKVGQPGYKDKI